MATHSKESKILVTAISVGIGILLKMLMINAWKMKYDEEPPDYNMSEKLNWGKLIIWTFFSGLLLRVVKIAMKRSLSIMVKKQDVLV